jgi:hypothetical protein
VKLKVLGRKRLAEAEVLRIYDAARPGSPSRLEVHLRFLKPQCAYSFHDGVPVYEQGRGEFRTLRYEAMLAAEVHES